MYHCLSQHRSHGPIFFYLKMSRTCFGPLLMFVFGFKARMDPSSTCFLIFSRTSNRVGSGSVFRRHPGFPDYYPGYMPRYRRNLSPTPGYIGGNRNVHRHRNKSGGGGGGLMPSYWSPHYGPSETGSRGSGRGWETASEGTGGRGWETDPGEQHGTSMRRKGRDTGRRNRLKRRNSTGSYPGITSSAGGGRGAPRRWHWRTSAGDDSASESGVSPIGGGGGPRLPARTRHPQQQPQPHHSKDETETTGAKAYNRNWGNVLPRLN